MNNTIGTQPYKGARDFYPEEMRVRNYIFDTWRNVSRMYGYEEYDFPIIEPFEIFAAKTGAEIVNEQLFTFEDKAGRKLAVRPELTPGTVRMLAGRVNSLQKPARWFMIGNNWRFEKPQKGRGREFYQLEVNMFGEESVNADFEIFTVIVGIMRAFGADESMFKLYYSDRKLIKALLQEYLELDEEKAVGARRMMDKRPKISKKEFYSELVKLDLTTEQIDKIEAFMNSSIDTLNEVIPQEILDNNQGYADISKLTDLLNKSGLIKYCEFEPAIIRGFDYSDGLVYEVFDLNPDNNRSMFGGERFDRLIEIFGAKDLPATGFAMGDMTLKEFLMNWNLLPDFKSESKVYLTLVDEGMEVEVYQLGEKLRAAGVNVTISTSADKLGKQFAYADKKDIRYALIYGSQEIASGQITLKDLETGEQRELNIDELIEQLK